MAKQKRDRDIDASGQLEPDEHRTAKKCAMTENMALTLVAKGKQKQNAALKSST